MAKNNILVHTITKPCTVFFYYCVQFSRTFTTVYIHQDVLYSGSVSLARVTRSSIVLLLGAPYRLAVMID